MRLIALACIAAWGCAGGSDDAPTDEPSSPQQTPAMWLCRNFAEGGPSLTPRRAASCTCDETSDSYAFVTATCARADFAGASLCTVSSNGAGGATCACHPLGCAVAEDASSCACGRLVHRISGVDGPPEMQTGDYVPGPRGALGPVDAALVSCAGATCCMRAHDPVCTCNDEGTACADGELPVADCSIAALQLDQPSYPRVESCTQPPAAASP